jgi:hypothetical protein
MKKLTIKEYADILRAEYPNKTKGKSDIQIVSYWMNLYPEKVELLRVDQHALLTGSNVLKYLEKKYEKLKQKISPKKTTPQPTDSTSDTTKTTTQQPSPPSPQPTDSTTQNKPTPPEEKTVTTNYVTKYPSTQNPKKAFNWKPCDENTYPWTYGCKNTKIGQMNLSLFGDRYGDIFGDELMNSLESYGYFGGPNEKKGEISKTIYDKVTVRDAQQQNESFNKKVVKETVKKVLKERLNKK